MEKVVRLCRHPGLHLPLGRDLRRLPLHLRLRPARGQHAAQREERLVARHGPAARRRGRARRRHPGPAGRVGGLGPPGHLHRPPGRLQNCHERWRADKIEGVCPNCGSTDLTEARAFNLMFKTHAGPVEDEGHVAYLRPETAQGMFINFANVLSTTRKKPPFGIAQVGKSFRNEITPQNFVFRTREFEQMEMEYFVPPAESQKWFDVLARPSAWSWYRRPRHPRGQAPPAPPRAERAVALLTRHGRRGVPLPLGLGRARGDRQPGRLRPHRPRQGVGGVARLLRPADERALHAPRDRAGGRRHPDDDGLPARRLHEDEVGGEARTVLRLHWRLAPYQVAVLPLSKKEHPRAAGPPGALDRCSRTSCATTTSPRASAGATGARTRWGRRGASRSTSTHSRTTPSPCATATRTEQVRVPDRRPGGRAAPAHRRGVGARPQATWRYLRTAERAPGPPAGRSTRPATLHTAPRVVQRAAHHERARGVDHLGHRLVVGEGLEPARHRRHGDEGRRGEDARGRGWGTP